MKTIVLKTNSSCYKIVIGSNIIHGLASNIKQLNIAESIFIISSPKIFGLYGKTIVSGLKHSCINDVGVGIFPDGENNKSWSNYEELLGRVLDFDNGKKKKMTILALGGGVVGDMAGFVASTYRRGVPFVQIPTTMLSAVDSSIGGKTGIDFKRKGKIIKNIVGSFYQPSLVLTDISLQKTLPKKELLNGLSEVIKYGIIKDVELFQFVDKSLKLILGYVPSALEYIIDKSCAIKRDIVQLDEKETKNIRAILNYGHTIGHAIEGAGNFKTNHGEAVAIGMVCEAEIAVKLGLLPKNKCSQIERLISKAGLPVKIEGCSVNSLMETMKYDKKFQKGQNKFILPVDIGKVTVKTGIPEQIIHSVLQTRIVK